MRAMAARPDSIVWKHLRHGDAMAPQLITACMTIDTSVVQQVRSVQTVVVVNFLTYLCQIVIFEDDALVPDADSELHTLRK